MNRDLIMEEYKKILEDDIQIWDYEDLRYSIFEGPENNRQEYQIRIEKMEKHLKFI